MIWRYTRARQLKPARSELKLLRTWLGRIICDIPHAILSPLDHREYARATNEPYLGVVPEPAPCVIVRSPAARPLRGLLHGCDKFNDG